MHIYIYTYIHTWYVMYTTRAHAQEALHSAATQERTRYNLAMDQQARHVDIYIYIYIYIYVYIHVYVYRERDICIYVYMYYV